MNEPELPWQLLYFGYGPTSNHQFTSVDDLFRKIYFDAYDNAIKAIEDRFNQHDFKNYAALQELILHATKGERYEEHIEVIKTLKTFVPILSREKTRDVDYLGVSIETHDFRVLL